MPFEMPPSPSIAELQALADEYLRLQAAERIVCELRVMLVIGATLSWRALETTRDVTAPTRRRKSLLFFETAGELEQHLRERIAWRHADAAFVISNMATPGGFYGVTSDWVPTRDMDAVFADQRAEIYDNICRTRPIHTTAL